MIKGKGVYSNADRYIFDIVISSYELNSAIKLIKQEDPNALSKYFRLNKLKDVSICAQLNKGLTNKLILLEIP